MSPGGSESVVAERYRLEVLLARGGFGALYRAHDMKEDRSVALKLLTELDATARLRFMREAAVLARLSNRHVVRLLEFGLCRDTSAFMALDFVHGVTLAALLERKGPLEESRVAHLAGQLLGALAEAHGHGIVHRDITPGNIMFSVSRSGRLTDDVRLLDFGIALPLAGAADRLTADGTVVGTPRYMAPEQVSGLQVGPETDLYSLGLVMAEALSGCRVYQGDPMRVFIDILRSEVTPLPPQVEQSLLATVIRRATEKEPARRYPSADDMLVDIDGLLDGSTAQVLRLDLERDVPGSG